MRCSTCDSHAVSIDVRLGDSNVTFFSCPGCGVKRWSSEDGEITLGRVLEMAAADSRMRLEPAALRVNSGVLSTARRAG